MTKIPSFCLLTIPGRPQAKGRPRFVHGHAYTPERTRNAEEVAQGLMRQACSVPLDGPLELILSFSFRRPNAWSKARRQAIDDGYEEPYPGTPDLENLPKLIQDAGNRILYHDDAQIVKLEARKVYGAENETLLNLFPWSAND